MQPFRTPAWCHSRSSGRPSGWFRAGVARARSAGLPNLRWVWSMLWPW